MGTSPSRAARCCSSGPAPLGRTSGSGGRASSSPSNPSAGERGSLFLSRNLFSHAGRALFGALPGALFGALPQFLALHHTCAPVVFVRPRGGAPRRAPPVHRVRSFSGVFSLQAPDVRTRTMTHVHLGRRMGDVPLRLTKK